MKKSVLRKVLAVALSATVLCGTGFTEVGQFIGTGGISVNASQNASKYGIAGNMTDWGADPDFPMYETETGIYVGKTDELVAGDYQFKVRADSDWDESYGVYEEDCYRTRNSQTSIRVTLSKSTAITVMFDTTGDDNQIWPISYKIGDGDWVYTGKPYETIDFKYKVNYDNTVTITKYTGNGGDVTIPSTIDGKSVTSIGDYAFYDCKGLTSIEIPDSVTEIGDYAFCCCTGLTSIEIPDSVTLIGDVAFCCCTGLTSIKIPDSVTSIGYSAFNSCTGLTSIEIPDSVTCIGEEVFRNCTSLKNIVIPDSVISLGGAAFYECTGLTSVTIGNSVTSIEWEAFQGCTGLTSVTIGNSVTSIEWGAFQGCTGLTSVTIGNIVTSIGNYAFYGCTGLTSIEIPDSVTSIGDYAFYNCTGLTSIVIPDSVTSIDWWAFGGCKKLTIYGAKGSYAETYARENDIPFKELKDLENISELNTSQIALGGTVNIVAKADGGIGDYTYAVFYKKKTESKWTAKQDFGTNDTVEIKPAKATDYEICVKVKDSTGKIVKKYFDLKVKPVLEYEVNDNDNNTITITKYTGNGGNLVIPDTIDGKSVTSIGSWAFYGCSSLTSVTIGNGVTSIGEAAFYNCKGLTSVAIGNGVTSIGEYAFYNCIGLTSVEIPDSVTSIGSYAFKGCTGLTSINVSKDNKKYSSYNGVLFNKNKTEIIVCPKGKKGTYTIPDSVTEIDSYAFGVCTDLTSIEISDSVTKIGDEAFYDCTGLTSIVIPNSVTEIGYRAFYDCTGLTSVTIGNSVTKIGEWAFENCTGLTSVVIPNSVTEIGSMAFGYYSYGFSSNGINYITIKKINNFTIYGAKGSVAETYANENNIPFVAELANESTLSADEIVLGQTVTVNAKSNKYNCTYAVLYKKKTESKWTTKQDFGTNDTVTIKPAYATDYDICVKVKDGTGKVAKKYFDVKVNAKFANNSTISAENIVLGQKITVNCLAQGGMGDYQYQVVYKQTSQTKWTTAQAFSENPTVTFKPAKATAYDVCVKVKDSNGTIVKKLFTVQVNAKLTNTSTISKTQIKKGSTVTVNGSATGGMGDYTYAVLYKQKSQTKWTTKQDFNANAVVSIKPAQATDYDICVKVKDKDGTIVKKYFTVTVTK